MWPFDDEENEDTKIQMPVRPTSTVDRGPSVPDDIQRQRVKDYLTKKYNIAADDSGVKAASDRADQINAAANIGQALEGVFRAKGQAYGGQGVNNALYDNLRKQGSQGLSEAKDARKDRITDVMRESDMERQSIADSRGDQQWNRQQGEWKNLDAIKARESDPTSEESLMAQTLASRMFPGKDWSKASAAQLKNVNPTLEKLYNLEQQKIARDADEQLKRDLANAALNKKDKPEKPTSAQSMVAGYGKRISQAEEVLSNLEASGYDRSEISSGLGSLLPNIAMSKESQMQDQAERNFINAVLRRESGAAISDSEFSNAEKQYFPRAGDAPEVMAQKKRNRQQVLESFKAEASGAWDLVPTVNTGATGSWSSGGEQPKKSFHGSDLP